MSGKKIPFWLKLGGLFSVASLVFALLIRPSFWMIESGIFVDLGIYLESFGSFVSLPLLLVSFISGDAVLYFTDSFHSPGVALNFFGYLVIVVFWFLVGGLIGWFTKK